jgi:glycosyltransferase involved in cell wall biosynthesis
LVRRIGQLIDRHNMDLLYVNGPRLVAAAAWHQVPLVFHCHSAVPEPYLRVLVGAPLRWSHGTVICSSRFTAARMERHIDSANMHVIYNGVADCAQRRSGSGCRIGVIGRIAPQKGQALFVDAARLLADKMPGCRFEICGSPLFSDPDSIRYEQEVRRLANGLPVEFTGWTDDICAVLARLDVLVVSSIAAEATTRVILEAFSAGVPVVAFAVGGIPEVVEHGRTGYLITERSAEALGDALVSLHSQNASEMTRAARHEWQTRFTVARYQHEVLRILEEAYERQKPTGSRSQRSPG